MLRGIDVSNLQGAIDWAAAKASGEVDFAYVKVTEGTGFIDSDAAANLQGAAAHSILNGSYHFARPDLTVPIGQTPEDEAHYFLAHAPHKGFLALDLEYPTTAGPDLSWWALRFMSVLEQESGLPLSRLFLYSYPYYIQTRLQDPALRRYNLWLASYAATFMVPYPWSLAAIWQYSDGQGMVPIQGINGVVDRDNAYVDLSDGPPRPLPGVMLATEWLKSQASVESPAIPNAHAPQGDTIAIILGQDGQPWTVVNAEGTWVRIRWRMYEGWVMEQFVQQTA